MLEGMASLMEIAIEPGVLVLEMCSPGGEMKNEVSAMMKPGFRNLIFILDVGTVDIVG
jgi:hypothetical protein